MVKSVLFPLMIDCSRYIENNALSEHLGAKSCVIICTHLILLQSVALGSSSNDINKLYGIIINT